MSFWPDISELLLGEEVAEADFKVIGFSNSLDRVGDVDGILGSTAGEVGREDIGVREDALEKNVLFGDRDPASVGLVCG